MRPALFGAMRPLTLSAFAELLVLLFRGDVIVTFGATVVRTFGELALSTLPLPAYDAAYVALDTGATLADQAPVEPVVRVRYGAADFPSSVRKIVTDAPATPV